MPVSLALPEKMQSETLESMVWVHVHVVHKAQQDYKVHEWDKTGDIAKLDNRS